MANQKDMANYYLKQDPHQDRNICEVFSSQFMRFIAQKIGEDPNIIANVSYITLASKDGIYIASELFHGYRDLFLDAYLAYQLPAYQALQQYVGDKFCTLPHTRPRYFEYDVCIDTMTEAGRYKDLIPGLALRAIFDDPDTHYKNIGATPIKEATYEECIPIFEDGHYSGYCAKKSIPHGYSLDKIKEIKINNTSYYQFRLDNKPDLEEYHEALIKYNKNYYLIPNIGNTRAVQIDFGGALGDFRLFSRRKFDGIIHIKSLYNLFRYHPSYSGPPAYHDQISDALTNSATYFFETLARYSMVDKNEMADFINQQIDSALAHYKNQPLVLLDFAERIGLERCESDIDNLDVLSHRIKQFLYFNFTSRQEHAKLLFLRHFCQLNYATQLNLMNSYLQTSYQNIQLKDTLIRQFFQNLKKENQLFFDTIQAINHLNPSSPDYFYTNSHLLKIKAKLHHQLCRAYLKGHLEDTAEEIKKITEQTTHLLLEFVKTKSALSRLGTQDFKGANRLINHFTVTANHYKQHCIKATTNQKIIMATATLAGALTGAILGAALSLVMGGFIFGPLTTMAGAAQGITLGMALGSATISFLAGANTANKLTRYHLFNSLDEDTKQLSDSLVCSVY